MTRINHANRAIFSRTLIRKTKHHKMAQSLSAKLTRKAVLDRIARHCEGKRRHGFGLLHDLHHRGTPPPRWRICQMCKCIRLGTLQSSNHWRCLQTQRSRRLGIPHLGAGLPNLMGFVGCTLRRIAHHYEDRHSITLACCPVCAIDASEPSASLAHLSKVQALVWAHRR